MKAESLKNMKPLKLSLSAEQIYRREFDGSRPGYDCLQVDTFLDSVIKDYESFEKYLKESQQLIESAARERELLEEKNRSSEKKIGLLERELSELRPLRDSIQERAGEENLSLIKRVAKLEEALRALGVDPRSIE